MGSEAINPEVIKKRMWLDYQYSCANPAHEHLDCLLTLVTELADPQLDIRKFMKDTADAMTERLGVKEVTIGLRHDDGLYRYEVMSGLTEERWMAHAALAYRYEDFLESSIYKFKQISKFTKLFLAEDNPYGAGEELTYSKTEMMKSERKSLEDTIEGDYLDISIFGKGDELLGWIETSGMMNGKFPDVQTIKSIEVLATVIGVALSRAKAE